MMKKDCITKLKHNRNDEAAVVINEQCNSGSINFIIANLGQLQKRVRYKC
jgi:hypothetical protein